MNSAGSDSGLIKMSSVSFDKFIRSIHDEEEEEEINEKKTRTLKLKIQVRKVRGGGVPQVYQLNRRIRTTDVSFSTDSLSQLGLQLIDVCDASDLSTI